MSKDIKIALAALLLSVGSIIAVATSKFTSGVLTTDTLRRDIGKPGGSDGLFGRLSSAEAELQRITSGSRDVAEATDEALQTAQAARALAVAIESKVSALPLGTVVNSVLPWSQFAASVEDPGSYDAEVSKWAPCDARSIAGSRLHVASSQATAPDLRGAFVRSLNTFATDEGVAVSKAQRDPSDRKKAGVFQPHNVGEHSHTETSAAPQHFRDTDEGEHQGIWQEGQPRTPKQTTGNPTGETRPSNLSVFRYVKIN